jgi:16S rRNA (guanine527-N7)-methyltransferase
VDQLALGNVAIRRGRAEDLAGQIEADIVMARAVASLDRLAGLASGLARPGGVVLAMKGARAADELERARPTLERLGVRQVEIVQAGVGIVSEPATVVRFTLGGSRARGERPATRGRQPSARRRRL